MILGSLQLKKLACQLFEKYDFSRFSCEQALNIVTYSDLKHMANFRLIQDVHNSGKYFEFLKNPARQTKDKSAEREIADLEDKIIALAQERALMFKIGSSTDQYDYRLKLLVTEMHIKTQDLFYER